MRSRPLTSARGVSSAVRFELSLAIARLEVQGPFVAKRVVKTLPGNPHFAHQHVQRCLLYYRQTALPLRISSSYPRKSLALVQTAEQKHLFQFRFAVRSFDRKDW